MIVFELLIELLEFFLKLKFNDDCFWTFLNNNTLNEVVDVLNLIDKSGPFMIDRLFIYVLENWANSSLNITDSGKSVVITSLIVWLKLEYLGF